MVLCFSFRVRGQSRISISFTDENKIISFGYSLHSSVSSESRGVMKQRSPSSTFIFSLRKAASFMSGPASQEGGIILKGRVYLGLPGCPSGVRRNLAAPRPGATGALGATRGVLRRRHGTRGSHSCRSRGRRAPAGLPPLLIRATGSQEAPGEGDDLCPPE